MHARTASTGGRLFLLAVLVVLSGLAIGTSSGQPGKKDDTKKADEKKDEKPKEKTYKFSMDGKPWRAVFTWLSEETGKPVLSVHTPTGSMSFVGPANKEYTMPEIIDIINEALLSGNQTQKFYLVNRERTFTLIPADEKLDPVVLPTVRPDDLEKHGKTEMVRLIMPLRVLVADDMADKVKRLLGPFGESVAMTATGVNQLILMDTVGNLKSIRDLIRTIEDDQTGSNDSYSKTLEWVAVRDA